jgi:hypothetical protein
MPFKTDKIALDTSFLKRSAKLLPCQKEMIVYWSNRGLSQRKLAAMFHCSRRSIIFIIRPEAHKRNLEARRERGGSKQYYNKEANTKSTREHRRYKYNTLKDSI